MKKVEIVNEEKENLVLKSITDRSGHRAEIGSLVEGKIIYIQKSSVFVDLSPFGTGIIYGREFINAKDIIKKISLGDIVKAKVVEVEMDEANSYMIDGELYPPTNKITIKCGPKLSIVKV